MALANFRLAIVLFLTRGLACLIMVAGVGRAALAAEETRPNVLVVVVDDLGYGDLACYGGANVPTPHCDRLAAEGMRFTQFYAASPICSPSRCGLLTGQFPARWRLTSYLQTRAGNRTCEQADFLDPSAPNYVRVFRQAGYATAHVGKWHLGGGRDVNDAPKFAAYGYQAGWGTYESPEPAAALGIKSTPWANEGEPQQVARHDRTRWMVDQALEFIRSQAGRPWLVNLWLDDVHTPYRPSPAQLAAAPPGNGPPEYRAVLAETDAQLGRLCQGLRELGQEANTLLLVLGDNGPQPSYELSRTGGLRGMKWSLYEGGLRTPCLVRWPQKIPPGETNTTTVVAAVDLLRTLCELAGLELPKNAQGDGESMADVFRGARRARTTPLYWEYGRSPQVPGKDQGAFPYPGEAGAKSPNVAVRQGEWKLLVNADGSGGELYDLSADARETKNVAAEHPEIASRLTAQALAWRKSLP